MNLNKNGMDELRGKVMEEFSYFCQLFVEPNFFDEGFHVEVCNFLQYSAKDKMLILPRGFLKTTVVGLYHLWRSTKDTSLRNLLVSNTTPNAQKSVHCLKAFVENNQLYQLLFPEVIPNFAHTRWSDSCACLQREVDHPEGTFEAAGTGANVIRRHFNLIGEDDTVAPRKDEFTGQEVMPSKDDIEKAIGFHRLTVPLLINEEDGRIITATRWASYDLVNFIEESEKGFDILDLNAFKKDGTSRYRKFSLSRLDAIRRGLGTYMFSMLYLNQPLAKEFMDFNPDWFRYYEENELPEDGHGIVTLDPADPPTGKTSQDYSAVVSAKHCKRGIHLRRYWRARLSVKDMINKTLDVVEKDEAIKLRIETNKYAHLEAGFREAMALRKMHVIIECVKAKSISKEARIKNRLSPLYENGVIFHKHGMRELEEELTTFPRGKHDDLIDAEAWQVERYVPRESNPPREPKKSVKIKPVKVEWTLEEIRKSVKRGRLRRYRGAA